MLRRYRNGADPGADSTARQDVAGRVPGRVRELYGGADQRVERDYIVEME